VKNLLQVEGIQTHIIRGERNHTNESTDMNRVLIAICLIFSLVGCNSSNPEFTDSTSPIRGTAEGLVVGNGRVLAVVDQVPAGFQPEEGVAVRILGTNISTATDAEGRFRVPVPYRRQIRVSLTKGVTSMVVLPVFSSQSGAPVSLEVHPRRLHLQRSQTHPLRAVGRDAKGHAVRIDPASVSWEIATSEPDRQPDRDTAPLSLRGLTSSVVPADIDGRFVVTARSGQLVGNGQVTVDSPACWGTFRARVLDGSQNPVTGAVVSVAGVATSQTTDADGNVSFDGLPPMVSHISVVSSSTVIGSATLKIQSGFLTSFSIPPLPTYTAGETFPIAATGLASNNKKEVLLCDPADSSIKILSQSGTLEQTISDQGLNDPQGLAVRYDGEILVADTGNDRVIQFSRSGGQTIVYTPGVPFSGPSAIAINLAGDFYVADTGNNRVLRFADGSARQQWTVASPQAVAIDDSGQLYVGDGQNSLIHKFDSAGHPAGRWSVDAPPTGLACDPVGDIYVVGGSTLSKFDEDGTLLSTIDGFTDPQDVTVDREGRIRVSDSGQIVTYSPSGQVIPTPPQTPDPSGPSHLPSSVDLATFESSFQGTMREYQIPGASIAVFVNGAPVLQRAYGWSRYDTEEQVPTAVTTRFRLASVSKVFTSAAVLVLAQQNSLDLSDTPFATGGLLESLVPATPADTRLTQITISQLLQMTAGLNNPADLYSPVARGKSASQLLTQTLSDFELAYAPGSSYVYSDVAYLTLGRVVEAASSGAYDTFVQNGVLAPIGISDMAISDSTIGGTATDEAVYYPYPGAACTESVYTDVPQDTLVPGTYGGVFDCESHDSTGGWMATATDLVTFVSAIGGSGGHNPLDANSISLLTGCPMATNDDCSPDGSYFGMGWNFKLDHNGDILSWGKDGALPGTMSYVEYQPQTGVAWAIVFNSNPRQSKALSSYVVAHFRSLMGGLVSQL
jgi:CubicO group peptidase (beta-lactamase class C family)